MKLLRTITFVLASLFSTMIWASDSASGEPPIILKAGNVVRLSVTADPSVSRNYTISEQGSFTIPSLGKFEAANRSLDDVKDEIGKVITRNYRNPTFSLSLREAKIYVRVGGLVKKPGLIHVPQEGTLEDVIQRAEGFAAGARISRIEVRRNNRTIATVDMSAYYRTGNKAILPKLESLDFIFVPADDGAVVVGEGVAVNPDSRVTIIGEVRDPGNYAIDPAATLFDYLAKAGGVTSNARYSKIVIRTPQVPTRSINLNSYMGSKEEPVITAGTQILVSKEETSWFDTTLTRLSLLGGIISTIALLILAL